MRLTWRAAGWPKLPVTSARRGWRWKATGLMTRLDFIGYNEKVIKLPDRKAVRVKDASIGHLRHQKEQLIKNHIQQMQGFILHHDGYVAPIIAAMEEHGFATAGDAIAFLAGGNHP